MARYLLTGAAGFIGARVAEELLDRGHEVTGLDNLNAAYDPRLKHWRLARLAERKGFHFLKIDIVDRSALAQATQGTAFDAVLNLAAQAGVRQSVVDPWGYYETNVIGTLNLLDLCVRRGIPKFVLASTSSIYGMDNARPWQEDADIGRPLSPYAASKGAAEMLCHSYHHLHGLDVSVLRYFTVYGPAGRPDMSIFRFVQRIAEGRTVIVYGHGNQERDFTYVDDIARGTAAALMPLGFEVINLGSDRPIVLAAVIQEVEQILGREAAVEYQPEAPADVLASWADITMAKRILDWEPRMDFSAGLRATVDWYLQEREWAQSVKTDD
jgi:UDP-glucuronate 4-epimerase